MDKQKVINSIEKIVATCVNHHDFTMSEETKPDEIVGWDSLSNAMILTAIEQEFGVKFKFSDMIKWHNIGELSEIVLQKIKSSNN